MVTWLVCKHICIPGKADLSFNYNTESISMTPGNLLLKEVSEGEIINRFERLPQLNNTLLKDVDIVLTKHTSKEETLKLYYNLNKSTGNYLSINENFLFPFPSPLLDFKHEKIFLDQKDFIYANMDIEWNGLYLEPETPFPADNKLITPVSIKFLYRPEGSPQSFIIEKKFSNLSNSSNELSKFYELLRPIELGKAPSKSATSSSDKQNAFLPDTSILKYILLAFLGGLILNLMPCVLPVISLKLFSLTSLKGKDRAEIFKHNVFYTLGVLSTFIALASVVFILKLSGTVVGWGFQLQSPIFILVMALGLFIFSLNMFGLFEFQTPGGKFLGSVKLSGHAGDFLNGILATILSTPCSAPFLGTASPLLLLRELWLFILYSSSLGSDWHFLFY